MDYQEKKAKAEAVGVPDAEAGLAAVREIVADLDGKKILGVLFSVIYVDPRAETQEIDYEELSGTAYATEIATANGGFTEALVALQEELTGIVIQRAQRDGYSLEPQS